MKHLYPRFSACFRLAPSPRKQILKLLLLPLSLLLIISITTTFAQEAPNKIYLSGQIINIENGAPIAGHPVYVESNNESNGGFNYYLAAYTDAFGFFSDTISTNVLDGSLVIYTYDENSGEYEKEEFFRFNWASEYHMLTGLEIIDSNTLTDFQANYEPLPDSITNDSLSYFFRDKTIGENIISWVWDFGDGSMSLEQNPAHKYNYPGIYEVKLTVSTHSMNNDVRTSTMSKKLKVGLRSYFDFGGHAFANYFPVDIGTACLYKVENENVIPIDTAEFDELGYYYFRQLIEGDYMVKTFPSTTSVNAGSFFPTYYGDVLLWTKSKTIELQATGWEYDIHMVPSYAYETGGGSIDGYVSFEGTDNPPVSNTEVILFNEVDNNLTYIQSDHNGGFEFIELPYGTYKVLAEVPGMYTYPETITLNEENPFFTDLTIMIYEDEPFFIADPSEKSISAFHNPYPNPATSSTVLEFSLSDEASIYFFILDNSGQVVHKEMKLYSAGDHSLQFDVSGLASGIYRIMALSGNEKEVRTFVKVN